MWDKWPSPILLKDRKLHWIFPGRHIIREQSWGFCVIWCMEGSSWFGYAKIVFSIHHFFLALWGGLRLLWDFVPLHDDLQLQIAERKFLLLAGMLVWWDFLGREGCNGQGKATALSVPLISPLWSNFTGRCVSHTSHQTPSSHLLYQISRGEKTSAHPGWCFPICHSLGRCFRESFDVGFPGSPWAGLGHCPAEPGSCGCCPQPLSGMN